MALLVNSIKYLKKIRTNPQIPPKNRKKGNAFKCILEGQCYLMPKPDKGATGKKITGHYP